MKPTSAAHIRWQKQGQGNEGWMRWFGLVDHLWRPETFGGHGFPGQRPGVGRRTLAWLITQHSNRHREEGPHR